MGGPIQRLRALIVVAGVIMVAVVSSQPGTDAADAWATAVRGTRIDPQTAERVASLTRGADVQTIARRADTPEIVAISAAGSETDAGVIEAANRSIERLTSWLGPLPYDRLTIVNLPVHAGLAGAAYPGIAITSSRWLTTRREFAAERALTAAIARQYALALAGGAERDSWFAEGLAAYFATRAIHESFAGSYYLTLRYFGGYVPHSLRAVLMSPNPLDPRPRVIDLPDVFDTPHAPWRLADGADRDRAHRFTLALHTLERFIGWPDLQATLRAFGGRQLGKAPDVQDFGAVLSENRGDDMQWFFAQAMRMDATFDYAVAALTSTATAPERWRTTVDVRRLGEATFDGSGLPRQSSTARSLPVVVRFADGSEVSEWIDGRDRDWKFEYASASRAVLASVDPDAILLLDGDRTNNTRSLDASINPVGLRLAFNWMAWLQDAMLACTAVM